jgi:methyl-accepting chemotaxis protein
MKIRTKLGLLITLPMLAIILLGSLAFYDSHQIAVANAQLKEAANLSAAVGCFVHALQTERGRTAGFLGSKGESFGRELESQRSETDQKRTALLQILDPFPMSDYSDKYQTAIKEALALDEELRSTRKQVDTQQIATAKAISYYSQLNDKLLTVIENMSEISTNGQIASHISAYIYLLKTKENAGLERVLLSNAFGNDQFTPDVLQAFMGNIAVQKAYLHEFEILGDEKMIEVYNKATQHASFDKVQEFRQIAMDKASQGHFGVDANTWFKTITDKINELKTVEDQISAQIVEQVEGAAQQASHDQIVMGSLCLSFIVLTLVIGIGSYIAITRPIAAMTLRMRDIADGEGDLTQRVDATRKDELGVMAGCFNRFVEKIQHTVREVAQATQEVASAATEIAATSEQMATSLGQQRTQSSQVAAAVEELSASVEEIASRASTLATHASTSGKTAQEGNQVVTNTIEQIQQIARIVNEASSQMHELGERSQAIGMVISVINDIADQTNLLALNAAIEAARAGQHGRGFAVVADEVRKLAERTTTATGEVAQLITAIQNQTKTAIDHMGQGTQLVDDGVKAATSAGSSLTRIVSDTQEVGTLVSSIAAATEEQSSATQEIAHSVESINHSSMQSNEAASQAAAAAMQLSQRSESLQLLVSQFKL